MSLKPCKECGKEISTKAENCPYCGVKIETSGCLPALIIGGIVLGAIMSLSEGPKNTNTSEPIDNKTSAIGACREFISQSLHNPSSAEFEASSNAIVEQISPNVWKVQRKVRAENGFSALRLSDFECQVELVGNNWKSNSVKQLN
jgi:hypothetical protein